MVATHDRTIGHGAPARPSAAEQRRRMTWWQRNQRRYAPLLFLAPALIMFAIFVVHPILQSVWISFHQWDGLAADMDFVGLDNYRLLVQSHSFYIALWNNVLWLALFMLAPVLGLAIALFLNQTIFGIRLVKSLFFFPFVISQVVVGLVFTWFYDPSFGLLSQILGLFGLPPFPILSEASRVTFGIIAAGLWPQIAYCMILYLTGLNSINTEQIEAARIDGAKGFTMLWNIVLPQLRPATFIALVVTVIGALRSFDLVAVMTGGGPFGSSQVLAHLMYQEALNNFRMGYGAAIAVVLFLIMDVFIVYFLYRLVQQERGKR